MVVGIHIPKHRHPRKHRHHKSRKEGKEKEKEVEREETDGDNDPNTPGQWTPLLKVEKTTAEIIIIHQNSWSVTAASALFKRCGNLPLARLHGSLISCFFYFNFFVCVFIFSISEIFIFIFLFSICIFIIFHFQYFYIFTSFFIYILSFSLFHWTGTVMFVSNPIKQLFCNSSLFDMFSLDIPRLIFMCRQTSTHPHCPVVSTIH